MILKANTFGKIQMWSESLAKSRCWFWDDYSTWSWFGSWSISGFTNWSNSL